MRIEQRNKEGERRGREERGEGGGGRGREFYTPASKHPTYRALEELEKILHVK